MEPVPDRSGDKSCIYFPRLTVDEEGQFCDLPIHVVDWIVNVVRDIPAIDDLIGAYRDCLNINLIDSFRHFRPASNPIGNRTQQLGLYVILAHFIEHVAGETVACVSFYSSGAQAAYIYSGAVTAQQYLRELLPLNNANRTQIVKSGERLRLSEILVRKTAVEGSVETILTEAIQAIGAEGKLFLKDRRGSACCLVAGYSEAVENLRGALIANKSPVLLGKPSRADGAHIPVYDRGPLESLSLKVAFKPPRMTIVGGSGEQLNPESCSAADLRMTYLNGVIGPLNTGASMESVALSARRIIIAGTPYGAGVLHKNITRSLGAPIYASDIFASVASYI
jgi:hypothetical protein